MWYPLDSFLNSLFFDLWRNYFGSINNLMREVHSALIIIDVPSEKKKKEEKTGSCMDIYIINSRANSMKFFYKTTCVLVCFFFFLEIN